MRRRIARTLVGVPLGLLCLPIAAHAPLVDRIMAALALVVYAMALPECYEISCGAYAFAFVITMGASGEYPMAVLVSRAWVGDDARRRHGVAAVLLFARLPLMLR